MGDGTLLAPVKYQPQQMGDSHAGSVMHERGRKRGGKKQMRIPNHPWRKEEERPKRKENEQA